MITQKGLPRIALAALLVTVLVISLFWLASPGSINYSSAQGYGYTDEGGGGGIITSPGVTSVTNIIDTTGKFTQGVSAPSDDGNVSLNIPANTIGKDSSGNPLTQVRIVQMTSPPAPPTNANVIGLSYDLGPSGATFSPPITLTFKYNPAILPPGVSETNLILAYYDTASGKWVNLVCTVNTATNTITAQISHFTTFSIIAYTRPAAFATSALSVSPAEIDPGKSVQVIVTVANSGDLTGTYTVNLKIDNTVVTTKNVTLNGGASQLVTFTASSDKPGAHTVAIDTLTAQFTVRGTPTTTTTTTPPPVSTATQPPTSTTTQGPPVSPPAPSTNWLPIILGIVGAIIIILIVVLVIRRRQS